MEELSGDVGVASLLMEFSGNGLLPGYNQTPPALTVSGLGSFKEGKSSSRRRAIGRPSMDGDEFINLVDCVYTLSSGAFLILGLILVALYVLQVDELQTTIEEEQRSLIEEKEQRNGMEDANGGLEPMHVD